jgi:flap endonuclease-1
LGIDAFNWLYQFLSIIRQPDGTPLKDSKGRVTSHLNGLFYRTCKLIEEGVKPCYVFDGKPPEFKKVTAERMARKVKAREAYVEARARGDLERARSLAMQTSRLNELMINNSKQLLLALGVPVVQAPSEGEAQIAFMTKQGEFWSAATQDYDVLLFGSPRVVRNLNATGRRGIAPELVVLKDVLEKNSLSQKELIMLGILVGTDYNPGGVKGIGPKKGLALVKEHGVEAWKEVDWDWDNDPVDILNFFLKPPVTKDFKLEWKAPNKDKVIDLLVGEYEFGRARLEKRLDEVIKVAGQSGLDKWFG